MACVETQGLIVDIVESLLEALEPKLLNCDVKKVARITGQSPDAIYKIRRGEGNPGILTILALGRYFDDHPNPDRMTRMVNKPKKSVTNLLNKED
ncbi:MAG: hypothetical protein COA78_32465 [Blastopirellula sp.]|nr:MAG: hypothetical protein COA78_32465 [Blastopirellula sp.]